MSPRRHPGRGPAASGPDVRLAGRVRRAKAWAALAALALVALVSWHAGLSAWDVGLRSLGAGLAAYFLAWAAAIPIVRMLDEAQARAALEARSAEPGLGDPAAGVEGG